MKFLLVLVGLLAASSGLLGCIADFNKASNFEGAAPRVTQLRGE